MPLSAQVYLKMGTFKFNAGGNLFNQRGVEKILVICCYRNRKGNLAECRLLSTGLKVGTNDGTSPCDKSQGLKLVPATSPTNSNQFEFVGLVAGTEFWSLRLDFVAKMDSSHDATSPCDLLQGFTVAGTSPIVCVDLYWWSAAVG